MGVVGLGMAVQPHALAWRDLADELEIVACCSPSAARREAFDKRFPGFPLTGDVDTLLADPTVEAVAILTPPNVRIDLVRTAVAAGKHLLLEKPLAARLEDAETIVSLCRKAGVRIGMIFQQRHYAGAKRLRELLASGSLGRILSASAFVPWWRPQSYYDEPGRGTLARDGGGVLMTQAIHVLDLWLSLAGAVDEVTGYATTTSAHRMDTEDLACAAVRFASGALGVMSATTAAAPGFAQRIELLCEGGIAVLDGQDLSVSRPDGTVETAQGSSGTGSGADPMAFSHEFHRACIADFVAAVRDRREPWIDGMAGLTVQRFIAAMLESSHAGRPMRPASGPPG